MFIHPNVCRTHAWVPFRPQGQPRLITVLQRRKDTYTPVHAGTDTAWKYNALYHMRYPLHAYKCYVRKVKTNQKHTIEHNELLLQPATQIFILSLSTPHTLMNVFYKTHIKKNNPSLP